MLDILSFILFIAYTIAIFFVREYYLLAIIATINIVLMIILKVDIKKVALSVLKLMPIIIFTSIINMIFSGISIGILIGTRLILICNVTFIYSKKVTPQKIGHVIEVLLKPLKIFKIDSKEIGMMICISITFIEVFSKQITELTYSLRAKGFNLSAKNILTKSKYILIPLITSLIKRVGDIETSLISKGYSL